MAELSDDMVRLAAAKDAEIARLRNTIGWEAAQAYRAEIAALTKRFAKGQDDIDRLIGKVEALDDERETLRAEIATLTEQRDRAMKDAVIAWSVCASLHREFCKGRDPFYATRQADFLKHEADARAALDAEAAAETAPSLPETPDAT